MAYLVVTLNGKELFRRELASAVTFGRSTDCDLWINDAGVSRHHCRVEPAPGSGAGWVVTDLGSRNGVLVHGERVTSHPLKDGEAFRIGGARITFHEVGFVSARPSAPTRSSDPMSETEVAPAFNSPRPMPAPRPAMPGRDPADPSKDLVPAPAAPLAFTRPMARPIPVAPDDSVDDNADGERSQGVVRRWLQRK